jgi:hypothetical protein
VDFDVKVRKVQDVVMFLEGCPDAASARENPYAYMKSQSPVPGTKDFYVLEVSEKGMSDKEGRW